LGEKYPEILPKCRFTRYITGSFTCRKATTWNGRIYFPSEGRRAEDFFLPKNPTASVGCKPATLGTKGQHATSRQPKPLFTRFLEHTHKEAPQSVGLLWTSGQLVAETCTWQHTTLTTDRHPCPPVGFEPKSQQPRGRRPKA